MPARNRKDAAKQGKIRGFQEGDIIGVKKAGRGNTGPEWLQGTILSPASLFFASMATTDHRPAPS